MANKRQTDLIYDYSGEINSTGSANAYVITISQQLGGYYQGMPPIRFKANFSNTGSATANICTQQFPSGLGAVTLKKNGGASDLASGDIVSGGVYTLIYDGTNFQVMELNGTIPAGSVGTAQLADGAVTEDKLDDGAVTTAKLADDAVTLAKMEHGTQGDILYYGASGVPARLAAGADRQRLVTRGSGANPEWSNGPVVITSGSFPAATTLTITDIPATFAYIVFIGRGVSSNTATRRPLVRFSTNNGSSFVTGAFAYRAVQGQSGSATINSYTDDSLIQGTDVAASALWDWNIALFGYQNSADSLRVARLLQQGVVDYVHMGLQIHNAPINALQVLWSGSGDFDGGTYQLQGWF